MIHVQIHKYLNSKFDSIIMMDKSNKDNIIGVFSPVNEIVRGFDQSFFYISIDNIGTIYFESFNIFQEQEDGTKIEVEKQCKPKPI